MKKGLSVLIVIVLIIALLIVLFFASKNSIINNTKSLLNINLNNFYNYINKYNYVSEGVINVTANYKGAHGSTNPINFEYLFLNEYNNNTLYTTFENNEGYYTNELNNNLINIFMNLRNNEELKNIVNIKNIVEEFDKIIFIFDESHINKLFNSNVKEIKLVVNTNLFYLGVKNYKIFIGDYELNISKDFKEIYNNDITIKLNNNGYNINYKNNIKINYNNKVDKDIYAIFLNDCVINIELDDKAKIIINKEVNIYNSLEINVEFKDIDLNRGKEINRNDIPIYRYFDNVNF